MIGAVLDAGHPWMVENLLMIGDDPSCGMIDAALLDVENPWMV